MKYFPVFLDLENQPVLVVGGGEQAAQKLRLLLKTDAAITVVAGRINNEINSLVQEGRVAHERRSFDPGDVEGKRLVYAATGDGATDAAVSAAARERGVPVNVVDAPEQCSFITPAIVDRDPVTVAIGTEGAAPVLAREIRARLEAILPANFGTLAARARDLRERVAREIGDGGLRRRLWERLLRGRFRSRVLAGDEAGAARTLEEEIAGIKRASGAEAGLVSLIGCGPGDPDLLTLRAQQRLQEADILVVDRLINLHMLEHARRDAERIYVGKTPGGASTPQAEINRILVREARAGKRVARLKGGDPFVFGRAVEEMTALKKNGIDYEIVPGVTAALACAASVALPVTARGRNRKFTVLTGATADGRLDQDWRQLAREGEAFGVYMGVRTAGLVQENLLGAGIDPATPVVVVENGTMPDERSFATDVRHLPACVSERGIEGPAMIYVGLDWERFGIAKPDKVERFAPEDEGRERVSAERDSPPEPRPARIPLWVAG